ncbi:MAG: D-glycero-beta-D-manno-heptose 1,7-bisphosphate 7-phosphatase [Proteobacteria bacterium]|nr:D-glycero-beta-D-manno-heptose 1,7-bisphosphate 7-phosphatase [Pseudomonadota bacterium]
MLIILDRDGVINQESKNFIKSPEEWIAIPGSLSAIAALNRAGHQVVVASNQSGISRGYFTLATLLTIHQKMQDELAKVGANVQAIYICPHRNEDFCFCRKPNPGMLLQIARDFSVNLSKQSWVIGDSLRDIEAGLKIQAKTVIVKTGNGQKTIQEAPSNIPAFTDLAAWVENFIS